MVSHQLVWYQYWGLCLLFAFSLKGELLVVGVVIAHYKYQGRIRAWFHTVSLESLNEYFQFRGLVARPWPSAAFHLGNPISLQCAIFSFKQLFGHNLSHVVLSFWLD